MNQENTKKKSDDFFYKSVAIQIDGIKNNSKRIARHIEEIKILVELYYGERESLPARHINSIKLYANSLYFIMKTFNEHFDLIETDLDNILLYKFVNASEIEEVFKSLEMVELYDFMKVYDEYIKNITSSPKIINKHLSIYQIEILTETDKFEGELTVTFGIFGLGSFVTKMNSYIYFKDEKELYDFILMGEFESSLTYSNTDLKSSFTSFYKFLSAVEQSDVFMAYGCDPKEFKTRESTHALISLTTTLVNIGMAIYNSLDPEFNSEYFKHKECIKRYERFVQENGDEVLKPLINIQISKFKRNNKECEIGIFIHLLDIKDSYLFSLSQNGSLDKILPSYFLLIERSTLNKFMAVITQPIIKMEYIHHILNEFTEKYVGFLNFWNAVNPDCIINVDEYKRTFSYLK